MKHIYIYSNIDTAVIIFNGFFCLECIAKNSKKNEVQNIGRETYFSIVTACRSRTMFKEELNVLIIDRW